MLSSDDDVGELHCFETVPFLCSSTQILLPYHDISWASWTIWVKLTRNIHYPLLMTSLDSGGQRSGSHHAVEVAKSSPLTLGRRNSSLVLWILRTSKKCVSYWRVIHYWYSIDLLHMYVVHVENVSRQSCFHQLMSVYWWCHVNVMFVIVMRSFITVKF